jgi:hypothetical protein
MMMGNQKLGQKKCGVSFNSQLLNFKGLSVFSPNCRLWLPKLVLILVPTCPIENAFGRITQFFFHM